jgi:hypothetical protein
MDSLPLYSKPRLDYDAHDRTVTGSTHSTPASNAKFPRLSLTMYGSSEICPQSLVMLAATL